MLPVCYICLRNDVKLRILGDLQEDHSELMNFCDQLCDYSFQDFFYQFCSTCIYKLKKCLQFKNQCKLANDIIKSWKETSESEKVLLNELYKEITSLNGDLSLSNRKNLKVYHTSESNSNSVQISNHHPHILTINISRDNEENTQIKQEIHIENTCNIDRVTHINNNVEGKLKIESENYEQSCLSGEQKCLSGDEMKCSSADETCLKGDSSDDEIIDIKRIKNTREAKRKSNKVPKLKRKKRSANLENKRNNTDTESESEKTLDKLKIKLKKNDKAKKKRFQLEIITEDEFKVILRDKLTQSGVVKDEKGNDLNIDNMTNSLDRLPYYYLKTVEDVLAAGSAPLESTVLQKLLEMHGHLNIFDIEYLATPEQIEAEFAKRTDYPDYVNSEYRCGDCINGFFNQKILDFHRKVKHDPTLPLSCDLCKMRFKNRRFLVLHRTQLHSVVYRCKKCPYIVNHRIGMENHYRKHEGLKYTCEHCPETKFTRSNQLYIHMNRYHSENRGPPLFCEYCKFTTYNSSGLQLHKKRAHGADNQIKSENTKKCEECNVIFVSDDVYNKHVDTKHKNKVLYETLELKGYKPRTVTTKRTRGKRQMVTCQLCQAQGTNPLWLTNHVKEQHPTENMEDAFRTNKKYLCDECGKRFPDIIKLGDHMNVHSGLRPYTCAQCGRTFHSRHNMYTHMKRHLPPLPCDQCGKEFRSRANLYSHQLTHKGDKCYKCELCSKGFITRILLNEHVRGVHLNIRRKRKRPPQDMDID